MICQGTDPLSWDNDELSKVRDLQIKNFKNKDVSPVLIVPTVLQLMT